MKRIFATSLILAAVALTGAGCMEAGDAVGESVVTPIAAPVAALGQAKQTLGDVNERTNLENEASANEATVAVIITEGTDMTGSTDSNAVIGCNDRVAYAKVPRMAATDDIIADSLTSLFALRDSTVGSVFHNALASSHLSVEKIQSRDGVTTEVWIKGDLVSGGACDDPRIKAQIEYTVSRLKPNFKIFLNGTEEHYQCIGNMSGECTTK